MGKDKFKKIPISEFISDKKLSKILSIIEKSDDVETNYDRIEMLLDEDYEVKDLGTNRLVLLHKKNKYKNLIFKVAGDSHGIEANYREFFNGDLDKRLTFSYSISKDGTFIVQERVKPMTRDLMKKHKKDVREMLTKLSKKLLLVDCKLDNFKNFGIRDNGDVCLLDHGDTVPLPNYQSNDIVNINEESFVSLRCKKPEEMGVSKKNLKPCGGKLKYSKNFDYLVCEECGGVCTVNDAYREFYGDKSVKIKGNVGLDLDDSFDPDEWKAHIQKYCIETMSHADNKLNNEGEVVMKTKIIEKRNCVQVKGFWLPEPTGELADYAVLYTSVKMGETKPQKYLEKLGLNIDDYKVYPADHTPSEKPKKLNKSEVMINEYGFDLLGVKDKIIEAIIAIGQYQSQISYLECAKLAPEVDFSSVRNIKAIREVVSSDKRTAGCVYNEDGFSVRLNDRYITVKPEEEETVTVVEEISINKTTETDTGVNDVEMVTSGFVTTENDEDDIDFVTTSASTDNFVDIESIEREYASRAKSTIVENDEHESTKSKVVFGYDELEENAVDFNGVRCVIINKYAVPIDIIYRYSTDDGYELPTTKMKAVLKANGLHPKKYKVTSSESIYNTEVEQNNVEPEWLEEYKLDNNSNSPEEPEENAISSIYSPGEYTSDSETFKIELDAFVRNYAVEHREEIDRFGNIDISAAEIIVECLLNHVDNGEKVEILSEICDVEYDEDGNVSISLDDENLNVLYDLICRVNGHVEEISCDYAKMTIGFVVDKVSVPEMSDAEKFAYEMSSMDDVSEECIPIAYLEASSYFNEDTTDLANEKHKVFNTVISSIADIFNTFYNSYSDDDLPSIDYEKDNIEDFKEEELQEIDICNAYRNMKRDILFGCNQLEKLYEYFRETERHFGTLITTALIISEFSDMMEEIDDSYDNLVKYGDTFMTYISNEVIYNGTEDENDSDCMYTENSISDDEDSDDSNMDDESSNCVNSYTEDNNTNNKEESATYSEESEEKEDDDILTQKVLDAIIELTKAVNNNSEVMSKQNDLVTAKLNLIDDKLDKQQNIGSNVLNSNTDDANLIVLTENDAMNKTFAVVVDTKTVCFDILELAKKGIASSDPSAAYLSVTDVMVNEL